MKRVVDVMVVIIILLLAFIFLDFSLNKGEIITGLIGYAGNANGNLTIWDDTDNGTFYTNQEIVFYANFTNSTGQPISDSEGNVTITVADSSYSMNFNNTSGLWHFSITGGISGTFEYNVTANSSVYGADLFASDNYTINESYSYYVPGNYSTVEDCFDAINNTAGKCIINISNYAETFSPDKSYWFGVGFENALVIESKNNLTINFNGMIARWYNTHFLRVVDSDLTVSGLNISSNGSSSKAFSIHGSSSITLENSTLIAQIPIYTQHNLFIKNTKLSGEIAIDQEGGDSVIKNSKINGNLIHLGSGIVLINNSFFNNSHIKLGETGETNGTLYNSTFFNSTIISLFPSGNLTFVNNTISNCMQGEHGISTYGAAVMIEGNTFENCGLVEYNETYIISDSMYSYGGNNFNESTPALANTDLSQTVSISQNGTDVSGIATGLNNFSLWLMDLTSIGSPWVVVYVEQPNAISCNDFATAYGGTCYLDEQDYLQANGQYQNYTVKNVSGLSIIQGNDKMFMNYLNTTFYANSSIFIDGPVPTNISRNIFKNSTSITMKSGTANIWLNVFINYPPIVESAANASLCVNVSGNFYGESADVPSGDCGQVNLTSSSFTGSIQFKRQSSPILPVHYDIFRLAGTNWSFVGSVSSSSTGNISYSWPFSSGAYTIKIVPWINGSRINGTNFNGSFNFTAELAEAPKAKKGGGGASVNVPPYIAKNVTKEEAVPAAKEVVNITPKPPAVEKPAPAPQLPAPSAAPAPALPEKKPVAWTTPLIVAIFIVAIIVILAVLKHIKKKKPVTEG